jgi:inositol transport system ATP-binding protein
MDSLLQVEEVSKAFWGIQALDRVRLTVERGEIHAVTGENGAGKSTLMRIIAGLERADSGTVRFQGQRVSMIHQELLPFPDLSVSENIWMGQEPSRAFPGWLDRRSMKTRSQELLSRLAVSIDPDCRMGSLSIAEQQSVAIAQALARRADLIVMDEPTSALSERESELLFKIILDLKQSGVAVIYISHRMQEIFRLADTITVMRDGRHVATRPASEMNEQELIALMVGRELAGTAARCGAPRDPGAVVLETHGLCRTGRFRNVSLTLRRGEILGLAGLMGAGRSDVAAALFGLAPATAGSIAVNGQPARIQCPTDALACRISMVTEDRKKYGFVPDFSVKENVTLSSLARCCWGPFINLYSETKVADEQIRKFDVRSANRDQPVKTLSGGNQQKAVLARSLLTDPIALILDEPTRGVDVGARAEIYAMMQRLASQGMAILLISSEMNEILSLSDRILVMREGSVVATVQPDRTTPEEILRFAMPN